MIDRNEMLRRVEDHYRSFWQGDLDDFDTQLAPHFTDHETLGEVGPGPAKDFARLVRGASADMEVTVEQAVIEGTWVAVRATWEGTHTGSIFGREPTGRRLKAAGMVFWRFDEEGRIAERWAQTNFASLLAQMDVEPVGTAQDASPRDEAASATG